MPTGNKRKKPDKSSGSTEAGIYAGQKITCKFTRTPYAGEITHAKPPKDGEPAKFQCHFDDGDDDHSKGIWRTEGKAAGQITLM
jgi:hypothetical protein